MAIQSGFGIGEKASQGDMLAEFVGSKIEPTLLTQAEVTAYPYYFTDDDGIWVQQSEGGRIFGPYTPDNVSDALLHLKAEAVTA